MPLRTSTIARRVIGLAIDVHRALGPGLLESAYEKCLLHEFLAADLDVEHQAPVPVNYRGQVVDCSYRADFIIDTSGTLDETRAQVRDILTCLGLPTGV